MLVIIYVCNHIGARFVRLSGACERLQCISGIGYGSILILCFASKGIIGPDYFRVIRVMICLFKMVGNTLKLCLVQSGIRTGTQLESSIVGVILGYFSYIFVLRWLSLGFNFSPGFINHIKTSWGSFSMRCKICNVDSIVIRPSFAPAIE